MFNRNKGGRTADVAASVQRFSDMNRDCVSRVKHFKILLDAFSTNEKRHLIEDYSFETFHLVDELLMSTDMASNATGAMETESGLWTLEQVLCLAPELVGNGWQQHAIESLLKKAIYPKTLLAVRKIAIRLFLIFYQSLSVYDKVTPELDRVFQCLLPHFPLRNGDSTELVLQEYCQSAGTVQWTEHVKATSPIPAQGASTAKERAQMLQVYLDKFLEYCTRETTRMEWSDESRRLQCAKFIIDRVIRFYITECFPDLETNGVDIFGGWEGDEEPGEALDTTDPVVIARYWLIRWMNNMAGAGQQPSNSVHAGLLLYHEALFSSHKATNTALTLMREAMTLPLPCSNVIHKVVSVLSNWLLQYEIPPFVQSGEVSVESSSLLLINMILSFFHSPYLLQPGERLGSATSITISILRTCRDLVTTRQQLPRPITLRVWSELILRLSKAAMCVCSNSDRFAQETSGPFANTLLTNMVLIKTVKRIEVDDKLWDEIHAVFQKGIWIQMAQHWAKIVRSVTRAVVLHLTHVDIFTREELERSSVAGSSALSAKRQRDVCGDTCSVDDGNASVDTDASGDENVFQDNDDISAAVTTWNDENTTAWLLVWRRLISLLGPHSAANAHIAVEAISQTIQTLLSANLDKLAQWLAVRLVYSPVNVLPQSVVALTAVLNGPQPPEPLLQAHILLAILPLIQANEPQILAHVVTMSPVHISFLAPQLLSSLPRLVGSEPSRDFLRVAALLSTAHLSAQQFLLNILSTADVSLQHSLLCMNALTVLILQRADVELLHKVLQVVEQHRYGPRLLPVFASSLLPLCRFGHTSVVTAILVRIASQLRDERSRCEVQWQVASLSMHEQQKQLSSIVRTLVYDKQTLLEGAVMSLAGQFPLPSFNVCRWNSLETQPSQSSSSHSLQPPHNSVFVERNNAIISVNKEPECEITSRTFVGRHTWTLDAHKSERRGNVNVVNWLKKEAAKGRRPGRDSSGILGAMDEPFEQLAQATRAASADQSFAADVSAWLSIVDNCRRTPQPRKPASQYQAIKSPAPRLIEWRSFAASLGFVPAVAEVPATFSRDLKHLDQTSAREVHKIAVIYVGKGQEDKQSILANNSASPEFDRFISELGWEVHIGHGHEGYNGGLPPDSMAPYYATADTEVIFHVSTRLENNKWKHIGNDEVHVVWTEHSRPYRRETFATKFCDVLIVIESAGSGCYRVRVNTVSALEFGPLYDGVVVSRAELADFVRLTALNASRSYRLSREDHARPLRHRESVFAQDTKRHMKPVHLSDAINNLYIPSMVA